MKCGLVILNYKNYTLTQNLLDTVKDFPEIDYIAVIDNDSPNESYEILKQNDGGKITVLKSDKNGGYSYGNNIGIRYLIKNFSPDIICIANPDVMFENELVRRIKETFESHPDYAILTGFQLNADNETGAHPFWEDNASVSSMLKSMLCNFMVTFFYTFINLFKRIFHIEIKRNDVNDAYIEYCKRVRNNPEGLSQVYAVEGSLFFIRTTDFEAAGLFDENVFLYHEEDILALKMSRLGKKTGVLNKITWVHNHKDFVNDEALKKALSIKEKSERYYFTRYLADNKVQVILYTILAKLIRFGISFQLTLRKLIALLKKLKK